MRTRSAAIGSLLICAALLAVQPRSATGGDRKPLAPLRVMSFNVRVDVPADGENAWAQRKDKVASMIRFHRADLVGLQEPLPHQLQDLETLLPGFACFGLGRDADGGGERSAILYRKERLELVQQGTFWLSPTPLVAGSRGWDAAFPRVVTWGRLRDRLTGRVLFHFNTHFDHVGTVARAESARLLAAKVVEIAGGAAVVVTGDFNSTSAEDPYRILTSATAAHLADAMRTSREPHHGPTSSWNAFRAIEPGRKIDFVFVSPRVEVRSHGILSDTFDGGRFPSDHLPVMAEFALLR